jgi:hypothetical protein
VTILRTAWDTPPCAECGEATKFWTQSVEPPGVIPTGNSTYLCSVECLRVWAIKKGLSRDVPKT